MKRRESLDEAIARATSKRPAQPTMTETQRAQWELDTFGPKYVSPKPITDPPPGPENPDEMRRFFQRNKEAIKANNQAVVDHNRALKAWLARRANLAD
jgi:hypothetical protein